MTYTPPVSSGGNPATPVTFSCHSPVVGPPLATSHSQAKQLRLVNSPSGSIQLSSPKVSEFNKLARIK